MQNKHFTLSPMQNYTPPAYPTRTTAPPAALKKLPMRWAKNAAMIVCLGALSIGALTGCAAQPTEPAARCDDGIHGVVGYPQRDNWYAEDGRKFDVEVRTHWGGSGAGPFYVAHLTEQEALEIIRNRLCQAGICFDAPVPDYVATAEVPAEEATAALSLFDERTRQGIVFPATSWPWYWEIPRGEIEDKLQQDFAQQFQISATFMYNPTKSMCDGQSWDWEAYPTLIEQTFTDAEKQEAGEILKGRLIDQIDAFLDHLRMEGVLLPIEETHP